MQISLETETVEKLSSKGVLAYLAVVMADGTQASTASLAGLVRCQSAVMLEGLKELSVAAPERVAKTGTKWRCGVVKAGAGEVLQNLDSETERRKEFIDDLAKAWEWANPGLTFSMLAMDGAAINRFLRTHKDWTKPMWKRALFNRFTSEAINPSQSLFAWVGRLEEYAAKPLDRYGKQMVNGGGNGKADTIQQRNREAVANAVANA